MTLTSIDAVINDHRLNGDRAKVAKAIQLLKSSKEFAHLVNGITAVGLSHLGIDPVMNVRPMLEFVENVMALAVDLGHRIAEQEVGVRELEAFFGTTNEIPEAVRVSGNSPTQGEEVPRVRTNG